MRALGITVAGIIGLLAGMMLGSLTLPALAALAGASGLAVLIARLIPARPTKVRRGQEVLKGRDLRVFRRLH
jgi:hypothetical protein